MYYFEIDANDKRPVLTEEDYENILMIDFDQDSPFLLHTRYDPTKFSMLSKKGQRLLETLLEYSDYSIPIATIGCNASGLPIKEFQKQLIKLIDNISKIHYSEIVSLKVKLGDWSADYHFRMYLPENNS